MNETSARKFGNARQAAKHVDLPYSLFRRAVEAHKVPYYVFSKTKLFKLSEVETAIESFRVAPVSEVLS